MALNSIIFCANETYESSYVETAQIPIRIKGKKNITRYIMVKLKYIRDKGEYISFLIAFKIT